MKASEKAFAAAFAAAVCIGAAAFSASAYDNGIYYYTDYKFIESGTDHWEEVYDSETGQYEKRTSLRPPFSQREECRIPCSDCCIEITSVKYDGQYIEVKWDDPDSLDYFEVGISNDCTVCGVPDSMQDCVYRISPALTNNGLTATSVSRKNYAAAQSDLRFTFDVNEAVKRGLIDTGKHIYIRVAGVKSGERSYQRISHQHVISDLSKFPVSSKITPIPACDEMIRTSAGNVSLTKSKNGKIKISWDLINGASFRGLAYDLSIDAEKADGSGWDFVWRTYPKAVTDRSYTLDVKTSQKIREGERYRVTVRPHLGKSTQYIFTYDDIADETGALRTEKNAVLSAVENLRLSKAGINYLDISWDKAIGAEAYAVYVYDSAKGKYIRYKTVTENSCRIKKLSGKTKYKIKIVTLGKNSSKYTAGGSAKASFSTK